MEYQKTQTLLQVKDVNFGYRDKQVLRNINFEIKDIVRPGMTQGQVVALVGQSGCGKSTLFNLLAGLRKPDTGTILQGTALKSVKPGDMGVVYQNYYLYAWRRVRTILRFAVERNPVVKPQDRKDLIAAVTAEFNLTDHLGKYPGQLSGGQQQRVAIAEQILNGGAFLLLDEPFSGLDVLMVEKVMNMLIKVSQTDEFNTLIIVSHDLSNAVAVADMVFVMAKQPEQQGSTIVREIDLIERGLAWQPGVKDMPLFRETLKEIKSLL